MKTLDKVREIFNQHELKPPMLPERYGNVYAFLSAYPDFKKDFESEKNDDYFINKYRTHIPRGWYGFSIGSPIIPEWCEIIDKILELCIETDQNFEIHQIKIKFGGIRFYCDNEIIEDLHEIESLIDGNLFDRALIY